MADLGAEQWTLFFVLQVTEGDSAYHERARSFISRYTGKKFIDIEYGESETWVSHGAPIKELKLQDLLSATIFDG